MRAIASNGPPNTQSYVLLTTTVKKLVHVKEHGRLVSKHVAVVKRIYAKPVTVQQTQTIRAPSGVRVVTRRVVSYRPVYRRQVVTIHGKPVTVNRVVTDTRMLTDTQLLTLTNTVVQDHTVSTTQTVNQTVTSVRTQTSPPQTVTVTSPTKTVTKTVTTTVTTTVSAPTVTTTTP